ncbi:MAG: response regulator transcription factor [Parvularculaceae bacterium]
MTILIIEDDERVASFVRRGLEAEGYGVRWAKDGVSGLANAVAREHRLIILDVKLPGADGIALCQEARAQGVKAPVLMLTARDTLDDKVRGLNAGADDYLTKPFAFEELLARVNALVRRGGGFEERPVRVTVEDLTLDRETLRVRRGERTIGLTSTELSLLDLLMTKPGAVFSREKILSAVWGGSSDPLTNVVDVYIGKLRRKIDRRGEKPLIETVRGRGYRLAADTAPD